MTGQRPSRPDVSKLARWLAQWLAGVAQDHDPHRIDHDGACGERIQPPCGNTDLSPFLGAERLSSGDTLCHRCGSTFRPHELTQSQHCSRRPLF